MIFFNQFSLMLLCLLVADAIKIELNHEPRGILAKEGEFKYQALLYSLSVSSPKCGGAIISEWYILSSAHCVYAYRERINEIVAYVGTIDIENVYQIRKIAEIHIPTEFDNERKHHDIALIRVEQKIDFSERVQPINLPSEEPLNDSDFVTCGFGLRTYPHHFFDVFNRSNVMHHHKTSLIPTNECIQMYTKAYQMTGRTREDIGNDTICTENVEGFCFMYGDEGNPLVQDDVIYGIASWNYNNYKEFPNVYTKVTSHLNWIREVMKSAANGAGRKFQYFSLLLNITGITVIALKFN